ncbi:MAG: CehA/McbA family metallohydrolase [Anaerolineales bacterium]|nr:CehA/McbA family metallohydrolase [Anaerolineales bacterium]
MMRYDLTGTWYKGNTHVHSVASDGGKTAEELARMYASEGYDFLFRTDHWVVSDVASETTDYPLLWLDGVELDGSDYAGSFYHVACLGVAASQAPEISREMGFVPALEAVRAAGALLVLAHPHWSGNSIAEACRWAFDGVEVYNHVCHWLNGKSSGSVHWNGMLENHPNTLAFSTDDTHLRPEHPGWNGGWVMVNAGACTREAVLDALRRGNYYSTQGPEFHHIAVHGDRVEVCTSPVRFVRAVGPAYRGSRLGSFDGQLIESAEVSISTDWAYTYLEIEDAMGRRAWTNPLFVADER